MKCVLAVLCAMLALFVTTRAQSEVAGPSDIVLRAELCRDMTVQQVERWAPAWMVWMQTPRVVQLCPLYTPEWRLVWHVVSLRWDRIDNPYGPEALTDPKRRGSYPHLPHDPLILLPDGEQIGTLSQPFPGSEPGVARVIAADWRQGFPYRIEIEMYGDAAFGDHKAVPLIWKPRLHRYERVKP